MYVCMYVRTCVCMYVRVYVCMYVRMYVFFYIKHAPSPESDTTYYNMTSC